MTTWRCIFNGPHMEPINTIIYLDHIPQIGSYVQMGDGMKRYVSVVIYDLSDRKWNLDKQCWEPARGKTWQEVRIETRIGISPVGRHVGIEL